MPYVLVTWDACAHCAGYPGLAAVVEVVHHQHGDGGVAARERAGAGLQRLLLLQRRGMREQRRKGRQRAGGWGAVGKRVPGAGSEAEVAGCAVDSRRLAGAGDWSTWLDLWGLARGRVAEHLRKWTAGWKRRFCKRALWRS